MEWIFCLQHRPHTDSNMPPPWKQRLARLFIQLAGSWNLGLIMCASDALPAIMEPLLAGNAGKGRRRTIAWTRRAIIPSESVPSMPCHAHNLLHRSILAPLLGPCKGKNFASCGLINSSTTPIYVPLYTCVWCVRFGPASSNSWPCNTLDGGMGGLETGPVRVLLSYMYKKKMISNVCVPPLISPVHC